MKIITAAELARLLASPAPPRLLDILPEESFSRVHLPTAENIPASRLSELALDRFGRDEEIVVYGAGVDSRTTPEAVRLLEELGYRRVYGLSGGIAEWRREGYELIALSTSQPASLRDR